MEDIHILQCHVIVIDRTNSFNHAIKYTLTAPSLYHQLRKQHSYPYHGASLESNSSEPSGGELAFQGRMERSSSDHVTPKAQTIILNVLSPSTEEVPKKLTFSDIPILTTVRALKERIQNTVPARPPPLRQRLIYQGKVLASDETSLEDVFGQEAVSLATTVLWHKLRFLVDQ